MKFLGIQRSALPITSYDEGMAHVHVKFEEPEHLGAPNLDHVAWFERALNAALLLVDSNFFSEFRHEREDSQVWSS